MDVGPAFVTDRLAAEAGTRHCPRPFRPQQSTTALGLGSELSRRPDHHQEQLMRGEVEFEGTHVRLEP